VALDFVLATGDRSAVVAGPARMRVLRWTTDPESNCSAVQTVCRPGPRGSHQRQSTGYSLHRGGRHGPSSIRPDAQMVVPDDGDPTGTASMIWATTCNASLVAPARSAPGLGQGGHPSRIRAHREFRQAPHLCRVELEQFRGARSMLTSWLTSPRNASARPCVASPSDSSAPCAIQGDERGRCSLLNAPVLFFAGFVALASGVPGPWPKWSPACPRSRSSPRPSSLINLRPANRATDFCHRISTDYPPSPGTRPCHSRNVTPPPKLDAPHAKSDAPATASDAEPPRSVFALMGSDID
jgi:hypothetical protein